MPHEQPTKAQRARLEELLTPMAEPRPPVMAVVLNDEAPYLVELNQKLGYGRYAVEGYQVELMTTDGRFALLATTASWLPGSIIAIREIP